MRLNDERRWLARSLILLLGIVAIVALGLVAVRRWIGVDIAELKDILAIIFPTLSALAGGAAAFYFRGND